MIDRGRTLAQFHIEGPALDAALAARGLSWVLVLAAGGGVLWLGSLAMSRHRGEASGTATEVMPPR